MIPSNQILIKSPWAESGKENTLSSAYLSKLQKVFSKVILVATLAISKLTITTLKSRSILIKMFLDLKLQLVTLFV